MSVRSRVSRFILTCALALLAAVLAFTGCSSDESTPASAPGASGSAGSPGSGGSSTPTGGNTATPNGGNVGTTGGTVAAGGSSTGGVVGTGGTPSTSGGAPGASGSSATGGAAMGGAPATAGAGGDATPGGQAGAAGGTPSAGGSTGIPGYNPDFKEFAGADCELPEPKLLSSADHSLPDPFLMPDGMRMTSVSQWRCQRAWLQKNIEAFVHGKKPGRPSMVTGSVSRTAIQVRVEHEGKSASFSIPISLPPNASGPVPGMFKADDSGVPTNFLHGEGVAALAYSHSSAESAYNTINGSGGVSIQIKWAWAVSRAIDVLVDEKAAGRNDIIDPTALGTTGCSYAGKSAFTVGAFDERIALGIPVESGSGGLGSYRVLGDRDLGPNNGEDPEQVSEACGKSWLTANVCGGNVDTIPADAHFLVAMYAPRGFTTLDNNRIGHLGPVAQFTALAAGAEVFKALGIEKHVGYHGGNDTDPHNHCSFNESQRETATKAIRGFLTKKEPPANFMEPKLKNRNNQDVMFDLQKYIKWTTPALD